MNDERDDTAPDRLSIDLDRDVFLRDLLRELAGTLQDVVGLGEASGFISVVGQRIGGALNERYRAAAGKRRLDRETVAAVLVDLKRRIEGGFRVVSIEDDEIVLENDRCPFADRVLGRPALCMMTSNVFGVIAAENLGYAKVVLDETIAEGHRRCLVRVRLGSPDGELDPRGREYFGDPHE